MKNLVNISKFTNSIWQILPYRSLSCVFFLFSFIFSLASTNDEVIITVEQAEIIEVPSKSLSDKNDSELYITYGAEIISFEAETAKGEKHSKKSEVVVEKKEKKDKVVVFSTHNHREFKTFYHRNCSDESLSKFAFEVLSYTITPQSNKDSIIVYNDYNFVNFIDDSSIVGLFVSKHYKENNNTLKGRAPPTCILA